jgi:hypothetical protein
MKRLLPAALVAVLAATGVAVQLHRDEGGSTHEPTSVAVSATRQTAASAAPAAPEPAQSATVLRTPERLRLWTFEAPVVPVDLDGETLVPPSDPTVLGWWGQPTGAAEGTTLLVGHTVSTGGGTLDDLEDTPVGEIAHVSGVKYRVERVEVITKAKLAKRAPSLFAQSGDPKLVIVTCEGYDPATGEYAENVVVTARPV